MATVSILHAQEGDNKITIDDDSPEKRREIAPEIAKLAKTCMVVVHTAEGDEQVQGYDPETNEWILKDSSKKISAKGTEATAVAPKSGG